MSKVVNFLRVASFNVLLTVGMLENWQQEIKNYEEMRVELQERAAHEQGVKAPEQEAPDVGAVMEQKEKQEELNDKAEKAAQTEAARDNAPVDTRDQPAQTPEHAVQAIQAKQEYDSALNASNAAQQDLAAAREGVQVAQHQQNQLAHAPASDSAMAAARLATAQARGDVWAAHLQADTAAANLHSAEQRLTDLGEPVTGTQTTQSPTSSATPPDATSSAAPHVTWGGAPGATWDDASGATWGVVVPEGLATTGAGTEFTPAVEHGAAPETGPATESGVAPDTGASTDPSVS